MKLAISQVCSLNSSLTQDIEDYAAGHCPAIEIWLTKLENFLQAHDIQRFQDILRSQDIEALVGSFQGGLLADHSEARRAAWELFERRLALCHAAGITTLVVAGDISPPLPTTGIYPLRDSLREAARRAADFGVRLALEFRADAAFANNLETAAWLVAEVNESNLGLCLDSFHYHTGPSKPEDLQCLTPDNLFHVQLCDLAGVPRELAMDSDRILPGEGDINLAAIISRLRAIDYGGYVSIELMNPHIWQVPPRQFGEIAMTALRRLCGEAKME